MTAKAKVICDSTAGDSRLTTIEATFPRCIHSEFLTHRTASRNAGSSRAVPVEKQLAITKQDPFLPTTWQMEQKGMQGGDPLPEELSELAYSIWEDALEYVAARADELRNIGRTYNRRYAPKRPEWTDIRVHKTMPNRMIETWSHITVIMSATEWDGFFQQRCHPEAEIHMQELACAIRDAMNASSPVLLSHGEWHLPYVTGAPDEAELPDDPILRAMISTARCARVSYLTHDGVHDWKKDLELCERLRMGSGFGHRSPYEHVAQHYNGGSNEGNFRGPWAQYRKMAFNE